MVPRLDPDAAQEPRAWGDGVLLDTSARQGQILDELKSLPDALHLSTGGISWTSPRFAKFLREARELACLACLGPAYESPRFPSRWARFNLSVS